MLYDNYVLPSSLLSTKYKEGSSSAMQINVRFFMLVTLRIEKRETPTHDSAVFYIEGIVVLKKGMLFLIAIHKKSQVKIVR